MKHPSLGDIIKGKRILFGEANVSHNMEFYHEHIGLVVEKYIQGGEILYKTMCEDSKLRIFADYEILEVINETRNS